MKWSKVVSSLIVLLAMTATAYAQNEQGIISINPHIGGYIFDSDQDINSDPVYGIDIGYNITDRWGVEGSFDYVNTNTKAKSNRDGVKAYIYRVGALYHFLLEEGFVPYLAAGAGAGRQPVRRAGAGQSRRARTVRRGGRRPRKAAGRCLADAGADRDRSFGPPPRRQCLARVQRQLDRR